MLILKLPGFSIELCIGTVCDKLHKIDIKLTLFVIDKSNTINQTNFGKYLSIMNPDYIVNYITVCILVTYRYILLIVMRRILRLLAKFYIPDFIATLHISSNVCDINVNPSFLF